MFSVYTAPEVIKKNTMITRHLDLFWKKTQAGELLVPSVAVIRVVTQGEALRDDPKSGCGGD